MATLADKSPQEESTVSSSMTEMEKEGNSGAAFTAASSPDSHLPNEGVDGIPKRRRLETANTQNPELHKDDHTGQYARNARGQNNSVRDEHIGSRQQQSWFHFPTVFVIMVSIIFMMAFYIFFNTVSTHHHHNELDTVKKDTSTEADKNCQKQIMIVQGIMKQSAEKYGEENRKNSAAANAESVKIFKSVQDETRKNFQQAMEHMQKVVDGMSQMYASVNDEIRKNFEHVSEMNKRDLGDHLNRAGEQFRRCQEKNERLIEKVQELKDYINSKWFC